MGTNGEYLNIQIKDNPCIIRDLENNKILAYLKAATWVLIPKNLPTANVPLRIALKFIVRRLNRLPVSSHVHYFKKEFPSLYEKLNRHYLSQKIDNTLIALEVDGKLIAKEEESLMKIFEKIRLTAQPILNPHISLSYLPLSLPLSLLEKELSLVANKNWAFNIINIQILPGLTTPKDYISFELESPKSFQTVVEKIYADTSCNNIPFPNGYKSHISLFSIDKNALTEEKLKELNQHFYAYNIKISPIIRPTHVAVFNKSKNIEIRKKVKNTK